MSGKNFFNAIILFGEKFALIIFGLLVFFLLLESGLRLAGFVVLSAQDYRNKQGVRKEGVYRILCLGESTTQGQYPRFLEETLNRSGMGVRFSVIDKGRSAINTDFILDRINAFIDEYRPDMVVAMMGINDWGEYVAYEPAGGLDIAGILRSSRVYKLLRLIHMSLLAKYDPFQDTAKNCSFSDNKNAELADDQGAGTEGGHGEYERYCSSAWKYQSRGMFALAEKEFQKAVDLDPGREDAYYALGWLYQSEGEANKAERSFKKGIGLNPGNADAYYQLGRVYQAQGDFLKAATAFEESIRLNSAKAEAYLELGRVYQADGRFSRAEAAFKKAIELASDNYSGYAFLSALYGEMGDSMKMKEYAAKADLLKPETYNPRTAANYRKLKETLDKRRVRLVCAQYPMRGIGALKMAFNGADGVVFVDNERIFKEAVSKEGYRQYFKDMFAGDFGHCTDKGNKLLADNIAGVILKEVFGK